MCTESTIEVKVCDETTLIYNTVLEVKKASEVTSIE